MDSPFYTVKTFMFVSCSYISCVAYIWKHYFVNIKISDLPALGCAGWSILKSESLYNERKAKEGVYFCIFCSFHFSQKKQFIGLISEHSLRDLLHNYERFTFHVWL
ncbi:hypothetical protein S83_071411 [Arachis hypogaea]